MNIPSRTGLTADDFTRAATELGCDVAAVQAIAEVETSRAGFLADGRPDILFEAHVFHRRTSGRFTNCKDRHGVLLSSPAWDRSLYGAGGGHQWERRDDAAVLDPAAANEACSWGAFQILGENWRVCGYTSAGEFSAAMRRDIGEHLHAFIAYCLAVRGLAAAIRAHEWPTVARLYNGPGAVAEYGGKLAVAYSRISGISVAAQVAAAVAPVAAAAPVQPTERQGNG